MSKAFLFRTTAIAIVGAAVGFGPARAQVQIYGGATFESGAVVRKLLNCFTQSVNGTAGGPSFNDPGCDTPNPLEGKVTQSSWWGILNINGTDAVRAFIAEDSRALGRFTLSSRNLVPFSSTAGADNTPDGDNTIPDALLVFDDNADEFFPDFNRDDDSLRPGVGYDPSPPGATTAVANVGYWTHHFTTSGHPITQVGPALVPELGYDCYEGLPPNPNNACVRDKRLADGTPLQLPLLAFGVAIAYNVPEKCADAGCTTRAPLTETLNISEAAACGLFTGTIDSWDDPAISGSWENPMLPPEPVVGVIVRADGTAAPLAFARWLDAVCDGERGVRFNGGAVSNPTWEPNTGIFAAAGNETLAAVIAANAWTIGFVTPNATTDVTPTVSVDAFGIFAEEVGNPANQLLALGPADYPAPVAAFDQNREGVMRKPEPARVTRTISRFSNPPGCTVEPITGAIMPGSDCLEPENWGSAFSVVDPARQRGAYPIVGLNWLHLYECYRFTNVAGQIQLFLNWYYRGDLDEISAILENNGFSFIPGNWLSTVRDIISAPNTKVSGVMGGGLSNDDCAGLGGAGRGFRLVN